MKTLATITATSLLALASTTASAITIDDFSVDQAAVHAFGAASPAEGFSIVSGAGIIGGEREMLSVKTGGSNFGMVFAAAGASNNGELSHSQSSQTTGYSLLLWDGSEGQRGLDFGLGADFSTEDGIDFLLTDVDSFGLGLTVKMYLFTSATEYSEAVLPINAGVGSEEILFTDFNVGTGNALQNSSQALFIPSQAAISGVNFSQINAIALLIDGTTSPDADTSLDLLETFQSPPTSIPLFSSLLMLFAGLGGLRLRKFAS